MPNNLTGNYDAVFLIRVAKINAILATLHQNGADEDKSPTFPHSVTTRIGDPPKIVRPPLADYAGFFNELLADPDNRPGPGGDAPQFPDKAPPGAAKVLREAFADLQKARVDAISPPPGVTVRGTARVQLSAPAISLPIGTASEVTIGVHTRALYTPDPGTLALPGPIHGEVRATYTATVKPLQHYGSPKKILEVAVPQDDNKIQFIPAPGVTLSPFDLNQLLGQIRKVVREGFEPVNTQLPDGFPFRQFKELGGGQVLALPLSLTPGVEPPQALNTVTNSFLNDDFSIGIGKEFVARQLQPTIDRLKQFRHSFSVSISLGIFSVGLTTYHVSVSSVNLEWNTGKIDLVIKANATASYAPDYSVTVRQGLTLALNTASQRIALSASNNDLSISVSGTGGGFLTGRIRNALIPVRDAELPQAEALINSQLTGSNGAGATINNGLKSLDDSASSRFSAVRVTPDGLILDGRISTKQRLGPAVQFEETRDGTGFTALESWIPGGRIDRFEWSWILQNPISIWGQQVGTRNEDHTFILPKPAPQPGPLADVLGDVCLRISGRRIEPGGNELAISVGRMCSVSRPEVAWLMPAWQEPLVIPVWFPGIAAEGILEESISAHMNVLTDHRPAGETANSIVHFPDPKMDQPLSALGEALSRERKTKGPLLVFVVLAADSFKGRRKELEARLGSIGEKFSGRLILTEDYTGGWSRTFDAENLPATYLLNGRGEFVWKQEGKLDGEALAQAMDEFFVSARFPKFRRLSLREQPCGRTPRVVFTDDHGQRLALRKLRGRRVLLNFWQSWSAPCIQELRRLQTVQDKGGEDAPVIVALNGGEKCGVISDVRRRFSLTFPMAHDPDGLIARRFDIGCWPTTVSINEEGVVDGVQFGTVRETETGRETDPKQQAL